MDSLTTKNPTLKNGGLRSLFVGMVLIFSTAALGMIGYIYSRDMGRLENAVSQIAENQKSIAIILDRGSEAKQDRIKLREDVSRIKARTYKVQSSLNRVDKEVEYLGQRVDKIEKKIPTIEGLN